MKKIILLFFILCALPLSAEKVIITSDYFSNDQKLLELIEKRLDNKRELKKSINKYFKYKGYVFTRVEKIEYDKEKDSVFIYLDEGRINLFRIIGIRRISYNLITTYLYFKKGDIFNKEKLRIQMKKLYNTGLFDSVQYHIIESRKNILIKLGEKKKNYFKIKGNYSRRYGVKPYLGFINRNFWNTGTYMDFSTEIGFWEELNYHKINLNMLIREIYLNAGYRNGKIFIYDDYCSSLEEKIHTGIKIHSSKYYDASLFFPLENYYFYNTGNVTHVKIVNGLRYGVTGIFTYNNERDVLAIREESWYKIHLNSMFFNNSLNYSKFNIESKWYLSLFYDFGLVYKNSSGYIYGTIPFDQLFQLGGKHQRGYAQGSYMTDLTLGNNLELENELIFDLFRLSLFVDTTFFRKDDKNYDFLMSYGPGIILNIKTFNLQAFYGISTKRNILQGRIYLYLKKIIY